MSVPLLFVLIHLLAFSTLHSQVIDLWMRPSVLDQRQDNVATVAATAAEQGRQLSNSSS